MYNFKPSNKSGRNGFSQDPNPPNSFDYDLSSSGSWVPLSYPPSPTAANKSLSNLSNIRLHHGYHKWLSKAKRWMCKLLIPFHLSACLAADPLFYLQLMRSCYSKPQSEWTPLTRSNFRDSTYRILQSGCYYLATDIEFAPNFFCCDYWPDLPNVTLIDHGPDAGYPLYPMGPYSLRFFAAITIEADNVVLDLNGNSIFASLSMWLKQVSEGGRGRVSINSTSSIPTAA